MILPALSTHQMREVDRLMIEEYQIRLMQMMENAGRNLALLAKRLLGVDDLPEILEDCSVVVLAGRGNNGGAGLVAARHLLNWGAWVQILLTDQPNAATQCVVLKEQLSILRRMDAPLAWAEEGWELPPADLLIDALVGYGLRADPRGRTADLIRLANSSVAPILSLDAPSGLDTDSGRLFAPHIRAAATMTLALPKRGLLHPAAQTAVGQLYLADISVPPDLYKRLDLDVPPLFARDTILGVRVVNGVAQVEA